MKTECTRTEDTQCECKEGLGTIKDHCVSCRDHPRADGCQTEDVNTTPAPHGGEDGNSNQDDGNPDQDDSNPNQDLKESKNGQERGLSTAGLVLICLFCGIVIGIVICLAILALGIWLHGKFGNKKRNANGQTNSPQLTAETTTPHDTTTPASARDRESDAPVHGNGEATLANGPSSSINANNISTSGEQPSSNSPFEGLEGKNVFVPKSDESIA
ncbi:uncharacterized protein LOC584996 [Strongylocentrotus purpuratus]|uniref:Uncharacterized protein n=1 Tax=Strongylocentrotus purpuratus TaxID=7668 RepID=A0A7M7NIF2_STRPU|nr:uncharacterized protein LOC584996 [Strongylocentrotus purpuratus]